jgi:hypothetical protein
MGSNDFRVRHLTLTHFNPRRSILGAASGRRSLSVFFQDQGEGTREELHRCLLHIGMRPRYPMGSLADGMS